MKSAIAMSYELDDISLAAKELTSAIREKLELKANTVAILFGVHDMEIGELSVSIGKELNCPCIGATTAISATLSNDGYHELAVMLHVLTSDTCQFSAAISNSMANDPEKEIEETYKKAYAKLNAEPKMVMCMTAIMESLDSDSIVECISKQCKSLPVFGFNAGDSFEFINQKVYLDGEIGGDRLAVLLISGNIKPVFHTANLAGKQALEKRIVTKSHKNVIYEIDGKPAYEYIKGFPFIDDETRSLFNYQFFVELQDDAINDGIPVSRALSTFDKETGGVTCFANVPENSYIGLKYCDGNDVANTTKMGLTELVAKMKAVEDYEFTTVIVATCSLRNIFLAGMKDTEGRLINELIPKNLAASGIHAFGEIAPTSVSGDIAVNRFHNATFTACAF